MIRDLRAGTGTTFIIATHDPNVAAAADRSIRIVDGLDRRGRAHRLKRRLVNRKGDISHMKVGHVLVATRRARWSVTGQRTLLAIFCVAVGVLAIVSLQLVGNMVNQGLTSNVREGNGGDISVAQRSHAITAGPVSVFDQLKSQGTITQYTAVSGHTRASAGAQTATPTILSLLAR